MFNPGPRRMIHRTCSVLIALLGGGVSPPVHSASHLWVFNEVFSNADGSIQFIELKECCGADNETFLFNKWIKSSATGSMYTFTANLPCRDCTAHQHLLLATQSFADLPGAPTPDYIIEPNFIGLAGDTLEYWLYDSDFSYPAGALPLDGVHSLSPLNGVIVNSPTNFAGETASLVVPCAPADIDVSGQVEVGDLLGVINDWGICLDPDCDADINGDGAVSVGDLLIVINTWGSCS